MRAPGDRRGYTDSYARVSRIQNRGTAKAQQETKPGVYRDDILIQEWSPLSVLQGPSVTSEPIWRPRGSVL